MAEHGTRHRYQTGCRCVDCREANALYVSNRREDGLDPSRRAPNAEVGPRPAFSVTFEQPPWMEQAACATVAEDLWFVERGDSTAPARRVCAGCPVRVECLEYAVVNRIDHGVWGGRSVRERRRLSLTPRAA